MSNEEYWEDEIMERQKEAFMTHEEIWQNEVDKAQRYTCSILTRVKLYLASGFVILGVMLTVLDYLTCKAEEEIRYNTCAINLMIKPRFDRDVCLFKVEPEDCHYTVEQANNYIDDLCK